jgi:prepilin-type N-terminal cleavage/methylation domain-containing protein
MKKLQKGFTLIELLVVIAIIGILSSIVLASLSSARSKGTDAAITSTLSNMRAQAELFASNNNGNYATTTPANAVCTTGIFVATDGLRSLTTDLIAKAPAGTVTCAASSTAWAVKANLASAPSGGSACADSTGIAVSSSTKVYLVSTGSCQ